MGYQYPFTDPACWSDSYYELDMLYARAIGAAPLLRAVHALWGHPRLEGPVAGRWSRRAPPYTPIPLLSDLEQMAILHGLIRLPHGPAVGCRSEVLCYGHETTEEAATGGDCALTLSIPETMIGQAYAGEGVLADRPVPWAFPLDRLLMEIAESVYRAAPFAFAVIGGENVPAFTGDGETLTAEMLGKWSFLLTPRLAKRIAADRLPEVRAGGLLWFPRISPGMTGA